METQNFNMIRGPKLWVGLLAWFLVALSAASTGALFMPGAWYAGLNKPAWIPPNSIFPPVWSLLYTMMAVSAWLIWQRGGFLRQRSSLILFLIQLALNAAWTPLFFGLHLPAIAFVDMLLLWLAIAKTLVSFFHIHRLAGWLLVPYLLWVSFAAVLNFTLWTLN